MNRPSPELLRYLVNGALATAVHFLALHFFHEVLKLQSAGLSNLLAAPVGIAASFLGNRYFVFRRQDEPLLHQAMKFVVLYAVIALMHGALLYVWSDHLQLNYRVGFMLAVALQVALGYLAGKHLVFGGRDIATPH
jgi:putative flippase GtrA